MTSVLLFSGGMDSWAAWNLLGGPDCLYVALGHRYEEREREVIAALQAHEPLLHVRETGRFFLGDVEQADGHIPLRNLILAQAAALEGYDHIILGAVRGETSSDKSAAFFRSASKLLSVHMGRATVVSAPFLRMKKFELVRAYLAKSGAHGKNMLSLTRSCYASDLPEGVAGCGQCMACFRRWVALTHNGISEPYVVDPQAWGPVQRGAWRAWLGRLLDLPVTGWAGAIDNNLDAWRALRGGGAR